MGRTMPRHPAHAYDHGAEVNNKCDFEAVEADADGVLVLVRCRRCGLKARVLADHMMRGLVFADCTNPDASAPPPTPAPPPDISRAPGDPVSFLTKVKNFAVAAANHVAAGMPMCTDDEIIARHDICRQCEHMQDNACSLCGCPVVRVASYVSKLSWADQECPAGKWSKIDRNADIDEL